MEQKTDEWDEWRRVGIGSSDAPVIMGLSPWSTPFKLWQVKTKKVPKPEFSHFAIERGNEIEPIARARYEAIFEMEMGQALCVHEKFEWLKASMDGWNPLHKRAVEIKFLGVEDYRILVEERKMPEKYIPQIQHQYLVTGAEQIDFIGYSVPKGAEAHLGTMNVLPIKPDIDYMRALFAKEQEFYRCMVEDTPPPFMKADFKSLRFEGGKKLENRYVDLMLRNGIWEAEDRAEVDAIEAKLLELAGEESRVRIGSIRIQDKTFSIVQEE